MASKLGNRYVCFKCGCKFYDLQRPEPLCPDCGADQTGAPARDVRSLLSRKGFLPSGFDANPKLASDEEEKKPGADEESEDADILDYNESDSDDE